MSVDAMVDGKGRQTYMYTQHELDEGLCSADVHVLMACNAHMHVHIHRCYDNLEKVDKLTGRRTRAFMWMKADVLVYSMLTCMHIYVDAMEM